MKKKSVFWEAWKDYKAEGGQLPFVVWRERWMELKQEAIEQGKSTETANFVCDGCGRNFVDTIENHKYDFVDQVECLCSICTR